jgi:hypothetical protein
MAARQDVTKNEFFSIEEAEVTVVYSRLLYFRFLIFLFSPRELSSVVVPPRSSLLIGRRLRSGHISVRCKMDDGSIPVLRTGRNMKIF